MPSAVSMNPRPNRALLLDPVGGPAISPITIEPGRALVLGKSDHADIRLPDPAVSRRHASIADDDSGWSVTDIGSKHGTYVNGVRIEAQRAVTLRHNDRLRITPYTFRVVEGATTGSSVRTADDPGSTVRLVTSGRDEAVLAGAKLRALLECASAIHAADDAPALWSSVLESALGLTGLERAAIIASAGSDRVDVIASRDRRAGAPGEFRFSRTLVNAARAGGVYTIQEPTPGGQSPSMISLSIGGAVCATIPVDGVPWGFLYLDSRLGQNAGDDVGAICKALAEMASLSLSKILGREVRDRLRVLSRDAELAAHAQALMLPPASGVVGPIRWEFRMRPGRGVAGDLCGIVPLDDQRVAVFLGDVTGKGIPAGLIMAMAQNFVLASLQSCREPADLVTRLNAHLHGRIPDGNFLSLWLGIIDPRSPSVAYVDAGHGLAALLRESGSTRLDASHGLLVGVNPDEAYATAHLRLHPRDRVLIFSDGLVEQTDPAGTQFGMDRIWDVVRGSPGPADDADRLHSAVLAHAQTESLADDLTIVSLAFDG